MTLLTVILPIVGILIGAWLQYFISGALDVQRHLRFQKAQAYADFFQAVAMSGAPSERKAAWTLAAHAKTRICIYGPADIARQVAHFERAGASASTVEGQETIAALLSMMRKDVGFTGDRIDQRDLHSILFGPV